MLIYIMILCFHVLVRADTIIKHRNWHLMDHKICGDRKFSDKIIGGAEAALGQYPWIVRLGYTSPALQITTVPAHGFKCGGTLINKLYVLTAAHCVNALEYDVLALVRIGENNAATEVDCDQEVCAPPVQDFRPVKVSTHEYYQKPAMRNDIALIRLDKPVQYNRFVLPICLPHAGILAADFLGTKAEVAGWGIHDITATETSDRLLTVQIPIIEIQKCQVELGTYTKLGPGQMCGGGVVGKDSCGGDSGGPLMKPIALDGPPRYYLVGLVSFGSVECGSKAPAVYTNTSHYIQWILNHVKP